MATVTPELLAHKEWLGQIQPIGLVVSPAVLVKHGVFVNRQKAVETQARLRDLVTDEESGLVDDFLSFAHDVLDWPMALLAGAPGGPALPDALTVALPEYDDRLTPTYALANAETSPVVGPNSSSANWLVLASVVPADANLDKLSDDGGWRATPHARLERLLRETGVSIGLLFNGRSLRLVYAPRGESSGYLTFRFADLVQTLGRPMAGALHALLAVERVTDVLPESQRLPALLRESRKYQNEVSTELAGQVLEALWELLRGFQRAHDDTKGRLLAEVLREQPREVYGGLLSTLMRLVFILYAEDRGLMPASAVYQRHYSVSGLFERLREDAARYPDTMDARFGAWTHLLALFRLIHDGGGHGDLRFPARHGRLFNPDAYPFLEGRPLGSARSIGEPIDPPRVPDGVVFRVLRNLLTLDGERLSYRALDVEQIGSVYEAMMGFALETASGPSVAVGPKHVVINLGELRERKGKDRAAWLRERAELKLSSDPLVKAETVDDLIAALGKKISRYTPHQLRPGAMYLQPTEERRRSGSHYTPRSLTEPIVHTTFRPIFDRLTEQATPEQILDLKVCDPAMGSGAFLVEACRLLADRLVRAWEVHKQTPSVPDDEDVLTYARRLVAERCLYGVDKNVFAVDLAKLSLWLATLAREHPFTFLDHSLRHGDSLVGLSREQIACLHWSPSRQLPLIRTFLDARVAEAQRLRERIQGMGASDDVPEKARLLRDAEDAIDHARLVGDVVVSAFFQREKPKDRETLRVAYAANIERWLPAGIALSSRPGDPGPSEPAVQAACELAANAETLRSGTHPICAFHWELEFPEVYTRANAGFDAFVGNPPFAGKNTIAAANRDSYLPWILETHKGSHGNADLVAYFYRRSFDLLRTGGAFGLIATNTIAQGDTRGTGLRWIRQHDGTIFTAKKRVKWPGAAAVIVSVVHVAKGPLAGPYELDGRSVQRITAFLFHTGSDEDPKPLAANANESFIGSYVLGMGFTFDDTDRTGVTNPIALMHALIAKDPRNAERIFPYIGGEEVNESPIHAHHRYVINFGQMSEDEARRWPDLMAIVEAKVKGTRGSHSTAEWWQFERFRPELYDAIRGLERVLVTARVSKHHALTSILSHAVPSEQLVIFRFQESHALALMQSRVHESWAWLLRSTHEDRPRYTPEDCFETYPFPDSWEANPALEQVGREYYEFRAALMIRHNEGLTKTYNRFHDPDERNADILKLRELHREMDRATLDAYEWTDIRPVCEFILDYEDDDDETSGKVSRRRKPWRYRWPDNVRDEVLGRLLELNADRASAAQAHTQSSKPTGKRAPSRGAPLLEL